MDPTIQNISKQTEIPVSEIPSPKTRHPFHKTPILLMSLFVLLVIGAFFAGTYYQGMSTKKEVAQVKPSPTPPFPSPTPDPTADLKTYTNKKYNFSFMYPPELSEVILPSKELSLTDNGVYLFDQNESTIGGWAGRSNIRVFAHEVDGIWKPEDEDGCTNVRDKVEVFVNAYQGVQFTSYCVFRINTVVIRDKEIVVTFSIIPSPSGKYKSQWINDDVFDQILKTFTFLDQAATESASN